MFAQKQTGCYGKQWVALASSGRKICAYTLDPAEIFSVCSAGEPQKRTGRTVERRASLSEIEGETGEIYPKKRGFVV
jgi:hypothetical protein